MKTETLYSRADWKYHKNKLGYDDVIDSRGRLVATINVMDIAADEMLRASFLADEPPSEIFVRDADGYWSIYLSVVWLTPQNVQAALDKLGKLLTRTVRFEPYDLPAKLVARYRREERKMFEETRRSTPIRFSEFIPTAGKKEQPAKTLPARKRLAALLSQKLKDLRGGQVNDGPNTELRAALRAVQADARRTGLDKMTVQDINSEISATRRGRRAKVVEPRTR